MKLPIFVLLSLLFCISCKEYEDVKIPEDAPRLNELSAQYEKLLAATEEGWIAEYQPTANSGIVGIYMQFHDNGTVDIQSNYMGYTDVQKEVRYRVAGMVRPELTFETECVWARLYHEAGGDYLFTIEAKGNDTLLLKPVRTPYDRPTCVVTRATPENIALFQESIGTMEKLNRFVKNATAYFKNLELSGPQGSIRAFAEFNLDKGNISLTFQNERNDILTTERQYKVEGKRLLLLPSAIIGQIEIQYLETGDIDRDGNMLVTDAGLELSGKLTTAHTPPFPYKGSVDYYLDGDTYMQATEFSNAMQELIAPVQAIPNFGGIQVYVNRYTGAISPHTFTLYADGLWGRYYVTFYTQGEDEIYYEYITTGGSTDGKKLADDNYAIMKPFLEKMCAPEGYTVIVAPDKKSFILVNRADSRYWVKLTISERNNF